MNDTKLSPLAGLDRLAYSAEPPVAAQPARYPWHWVSARAALVAAFGALLAGGLIDVGYQRAATEPVAESLTVTPPAPVEVPTVAPGPWQPPVVPDAPHKLAGDAWFVSMVGAGLAPVDMSVKDPAGIVDDGHNVCNYMAAGHSEAQTVNEVVVGLPASLGPAKARTIAVAVVNAAVAAYCPEEGR